MPAIPLLAELQVAEFVKSIVLPSAYVAIALNCWVPFTGIVMAGGAIANEASVAGPTVRFTLPLIVPEVATIWVVP